MSKRRVVRTPEQRLAVLEKAVRSLDRHHDAMQREIDALGAASAGHDYTSQQRDERLSDRLAKIEERVNVLDRLTVLLADAEIRATYKAAPHSWWRRALAWRPWR